MNIKRCFVLIFLFLILFSCIKRREIKVESEKNTVEGIVSEFVQGLEQLDVEKVLGFYNKSPNTVLIGAGDEFFRGYDAVENYYREFIPSLSKWNNRKFVLIEPKIRILDGVAWFNSQLKLNYQQNEKPIKNDARFTGVLIKEEGTWRLVQVHLSLSSP